MNAGAYGREIKEVLISATALDRRGRTHSLDCEAMRLSYRHSEVDPGWIFTEARLRGVPGDRAAIASRLNEIRAAREAAQPVRARTGGSTFKNPRGQSAWRLIDAAGCRGLARGGAMISKKHANFLINTGNATAADLEALGDEVRRRVHETSGIVLEWEIERIGRPVQGVEQTRHFTLSPRRPGGEAGVRGPTRDSPVLRTSPLPALRTGLLPLPPEGGEGFRGGDW
jgi:UDP-N-acetylmuramate dehydrogenase